MKATNLHKSPFNLAAIAAGLGFFVDAFDLFLFSIYRIPSLTELGLTGDALKSEGEKLLAVQMLGMMIGGILTGIIVKVGLRYFSDQYYCIQQQILPMLLLATLPAMQSSGF